MRTIRKIEQSIPIIKKRKKVAAYARVFMESERMQHSLSAQVSYYSSLIQKNPEPRRTISDSLPKTLSQGFRELQCPTRL